MALSGAAGGTRHLIHIGYPKTGSKLLQRWFAAHPDLAYAPWGIAGFADAHALVTAAAAPEARAWRVTSHEALATPVADLADPGSGRSPRLPTRAAQARACDLMASLFPGATILIVTRGFETLLPSVHGELVRGGAGYGFDSFCAALLDQVRSGNDAFHFDALIDRYAAAFGEERVIVLPYERLRDRPDTFFGAVEARLGLAPLAFTAERVRPSPSAERTDSYRRLNRWLRLIPAGAALRRRWVGALRAGRLDRVAAGLEGSAGADRDLPPDLRAALGGRSERLRAGPLYSGLGEEYLF
jgi:Sulfotransferase family